METEIQKYEQDQKSNSVEQIRSSLALLILKLGITLLFYEGLYSLFYFITNIAFNLPMEWHHQISAGVLIINLLKIGIELFTIIWLVLSWSSNVYFLAGKHLIKRTGIISTKEDVFHFDNIRSISVSQSFTGKLLNYGDITLKTSASGGYQGDVTFIQIDSPSKYEEKIKNLF